MSLGHNQLTARADDNSSPFEHTMLRRNSMDRYAVSYHGYAHSHIDALTRRVCPVGRRMAWRTSTPIRHSRDPRASVFSSRSDRGSGQHSALSPDQDRSAHWVE